MGIKKIDEEKLRSLGVPEDVIASMDIRDGGNIDPQGNVLFLDRQRQRSKEHPEKPLRVNRPRGLGIRNKMADMSGRKAGSPESNPARMFRFLEESAKAPKKSLRYRMVVDEMLGFGANGYTGGTVLPLNIDLKDKAHNIVLPIDPVLMLSIMLSILQYSIPASAEGHMTVMIIRSISAASL